MLVRRIVPFLLLSIFITAFFIISCDTLVTENNTIIVVDSTIAVDCFICHSDTDNLLLRPNGQFKNSAHANFDLLDAPGMECGTACHTHEGFLKTFDSLNIQTTAPSAINCYTCHLPHSGNYGEWDIDTLRLSDTPPLFLSGFGADLGKSNNCGHCHSAVNTVTTSGAISLDSTFGPHYSPQADVMSGRNGFFVNIETPEVNDHQGNGCIKCHYGTNIGDGQGYLYAEHTFRLESDNGGQYLNTCNAATPCHGGDLLDFYSDAKIATIDTLSKVVQSHFEAFGILDPADSTGLTFSADSATNTQAKLLYNYLLYKHDNSRGIHNINFVTKLLDTTKILLDSLPPIVDFYSDIQQSCVSDLITFTPIITGDFDTLIWTFGDGNAITSTTADPVTNTYNTYGIFNVNLTAISNYTEFPADTTVPASSEYQRDGYIVADTTPVAEFGAQDGLTSICINDSVVFLDSTISLSSASYTWSTGVGSLDSSTSNLTRLTQQNPVLVFDSLGTYSISLIAQTSCGTDTLVKTDYITVDGAMAQIGVSSVDTTFTFSSNSLGVIDSIQWDIDGDNTFDSTVMAPFNPIVVEYARGLTASLVQLRVFHATCPADYDLTFISTPAK